MGEFIGILLWVLSAKRISVLGDLCVFLPLRPITCRYICNMPVRWLHLSTADCHLVRLPSTTSFWNCPFRSLSVSSAGFSRRFRYRSSASDLADAGRVGWICRMRPVGMKIAMALFTAFLKAYSAYSTVHLSPATARYSSKVSA